MDTATSLPPSAVPFSLLFAQKVVPVCNDDQTVGAETEVESGRDGIVRKDQEEDEDTEK
jgi:hypothetical protein